MHADNNNLNALFITDENDDHEIYKQIYQATIGIDQNEAYFKSRICKNVGNTSIQSCLQTIQKRMKEYTNEFLLISHLLFEILKQFPSEQDESSLLSCNQIFSDLYVKLWSFTSSSVTFGGSKKFCETEEYMSLKRLLHVSSTNTIKGMISSMINLIKMKAEDDQARYGADFLSDLFEFYELLDNMKSGMIDDYENVAQKNDEDQLTELKGLTLDETKKKSKPVGRKSSMRTLKPISENSSPQKSTPILSQREENQQKTKKANEFTVNMIEWLSSKFAYYFNKENFQNVEHNFMNHFCYSKFERMQKAIFDVQRLNVHACLLNSFGYMKLNEVLQANPAVEIESPRKRRKSGKDVEQKSFQELSEGVLLPINVAYKLYLECGHMINLHDWLQV